MKSINLTPDNYEENANRLVDFLNDLFIDMNLTMAELTTTLGLMCLALGGHSECPPDEPCVLQSPRIRQLAERVREALTGLGATPQEAALVYGGMLCGLGKELATKHPDRPAYLPAGRRRPEQNVN